MFKQPLTDVAVIETLSIFGRAQNPCDGQGCSHICAIKARSFRCLCPNGIYMAEDDRNCIYWDGGLKALYVRRYGTGLQ